MFTEPPGEIRVAEAPIGSVVVFSSLTPHLTGPNLTDEVRKAYIVQYAPVGAERLDGDPLAGPPTARTAAMIPPASSRSSETTARSDPFLGTDRTDGGVI